MTGRLRNCRLTCLEIHGQSFAMVTQTGCQKGEHERSKVGFGPTHKLSKSTARFQRRVALVLGCCFLSLSGPFKVAEPSSRLGWLSWASEYGLSHKIEELCVSLCDNPQKGTLKRKILFMSTASLRLNAFSTEPVNLRPRLAVSQVESTLMIVYLPLAKILTSSLTVS